MFTGSMGKFAVSCSYAREDEPIMARKANRAFGGMSNFDLLP
jgi:hypothetical protein